MLRGITMRLRLHCRVPCNIGKRLHGSGTEQCQLLEGTRETRLRHKEVESYVRATGVRGGILRVRASLRGS